MKFNSRIHLLGSAAALCCAIPAYAQTSAEVTEQASQAESFNEIVVTARRREERLTEVPIAITAFGQELLDTKQIREVRELTKLTPGLNFGGGGSLASPVVTIRGFSRALAGPGSPGVIAYFNEVPLSNLGANIPSFDMDNIQVLKGPQGTLFGRNAIGGAILGYSKKPSYDFGGYAEGEYGTLNSMRLEGAINVPVIADKVAIRVAGQMISSDGFVKGLLYGPVSYTRGATIANTVSRPGPLLTDRPIDYDEKNVRSVRASLLLDPADGLSNITTVDYTRYSGAGGIVPIQLLPGSLPSVPAAFLPFLPLGNLSGLLGPVWHCGTAVNCDINLAMAAAQADPRTQYSDVRPYSVTESFGVTNTTSFDISDNLTLKNIFGYRTLKQDNTTDLDGTALNIVSASAITNQKQVTDELQLSGSLLSDTLQFVVGGFYYKTSPDGIGGDQALLTYILGGVSVGYAANYLESTSKALYGQLDYDASALLPGLKFTAGYRYTWDRQNGCAYGAEYGQLFQVGTNRVTPVPGGRPSFTPTYDQCRSGNFTPDPDAVPGRTSAQNLSAKSAKGTYTFAVNWKASDALLLYATARRGYRAGGYNVPVLNPVIADVQSFAPEVLDDIEVGAKGNFALGSVRGNYSLAAFRGKIKGAQTFVSTSGINTAVLPPAGIVLNKNDYTQKGFEADLQLQPFDGLSIGGNAAYIKAKLDKFNVPQSILSIYEAAGAASVLNTFAIYNQPKWQANANIAYTARNVVGGGDFFIGADYHYQSSYAQNDIMVDGYETVDARLGLKGLYDDAVDVTVWVKNLFDEEHFHGASLSARSAGVISMLQAPPRTAGVSVRYNF